MKTVIVDIDGTISKYMAGGHLAIMETPHEVLPGVVDKMRQWESQGHRIILMTGRRESVRDNEPRSELRRIRHPLGYFTYGSR